ncbi:GTP-binding protein, partial [Streptomyces sp. NPDC055189]
MHTSSTSNTLNLGILAHVDAGKTSLTERLLHAAGVIDEIGRVDAGNTQTDSLALERQRGITIKSAVVSFAVDDVTVNLIDTPGHPDFIAEVERVLSVLDGAVLVISAVEGVQAQTRVLMRTLRRLRIPTLVFVNKIDRRGARHGDLLRDIAERLVPDIVPMGTVTGLGARDGAFVPYDADDPAHTARLVDVLAAHDDDLLSAYVEDDAGLSPERLRAALGAQSAQALVHPVFFGSAATGAGIGELMAGIRELLPSEDGATRAGDPVSGTVFKVERGDAGEKVAYVRMFAGTVRTRDRLPFGGGREGKVTAVSVFDRGSAAPREGVSAGQIGKLWGLGDIRIGDVVGVPHAEGKRAGQHHFSPPTLETVVVPARPGDKGALHLALAQLAEQDPLIDLRQDDLRQEVYVSLYGEVQKEVIQATLLDEYGIDVAFRGTTTICVERVTGSGSAYEIIDKDDNPFLATVGLRVEPGPPDSGVEFRLEIELGSMPYAFFRAVEETVRETLLQGVHGWEVSDCVVTMTHSGYWPRQSHAHGTFDKSMSSTAGDFRQLTPLVLLSALRRAGTEVHEPLHRFDLSVPDDVFGQLLPALSRLRAVPHTQTARGASYVVEGEIPAARVHELEQLLPSLTRGEGELESAFERYRAVGGGGAAPPPPPPQTPPPPPQKKKKKKNHPNAPKEV